MINTELKKKVDRIYDIFCMSGITNPLEILDTITYILFIKLLDDSAKNLNTYSHVFNKKNQHVRWDKIVEYEAEYLYKVVKYELVEFIKSLDIENISSYSKYIGNTGIDIPEPSSLKKIITQIDSIDIDKSSDLIGDVYEYMISKLGTSKINGQFRTPIHIVELMVRLMDPSPTHKIIDPAVGSGGFIVSSIKYIRKNYKTEVIDSKNFYGYDIDKTMIKISIINLMLNGLNNPNIEYKNSLEDDTETKYDLILTNPPFKGSLDEEKINEKLLKSIKTKKNELLFLSLFIEMLNEGGKCATIVTDGVLFGLSNAHIKIKKNIVDNNKLEAIISMPSGVFKPYSGVSTSIMIFKKSKVEKTDHVWFYDMQQDGYSLDDKRAPIEKSDIEDIVNRFKNRDKEYIRKRTEKSFYVSVEEIRKNKYDLSISKYKELEYMEVKQENSRELLSSIYELEKEIFKSIENLKCMIEEIGYE